MILYSSKEQEQSKRNVIHFLGSFFTVLYILLQIIHIFAIIGCLTSTLHGLLSNFGWVIVSLCTSFDLIFGIILCCFYELNYEKWKNILLNTWIIYFISLLLHIALPLYFLIMMLISEEPDRSKHKANLTLFIIFSGFDLISLTIPMIFYSFLYSKSKYQTYIPINYSS